MEVLAIPVLTAYDWRRIQSATLQGAPKLYDVMPSMRVVHR